MIQRLAVLLTGGVPPARAWQYLDSDSGVVRAVVGSGAQSTGIPDAIQSAVERLDVGNASERALAESWRGLAAAWFVASESGAPIAACLRQLADSYRSLAETQRDIHIALVGPQTTAKMVMLLPVVGMLFGIGLGFDILNILFATVPGLICVTAGAALMWLGGRWNRRMIASAQPTDATPGLTVDLMAVAMSGGASLDRARDLVDRAANRFSVSGLVAGSGDQLVIDQVLGLAARAGVPAGELLRSEAAQLRRQARFDGQRAAASLAVKLMLPLGLCVLPAFMLVGVAPLVMAVLSSTVSGW